MGKIFSLDSPFFILPIWDENEEGKVLKNALYTNTLNLSLFFSFFLLSPIRSNVVPLVVVVVVVVVVFFYFFF